ncbi:hypothetical protein BASA81_006580 [Batrachochytrium salamandrivorans]|nr:hypothetical protein BASA81_006580 [Batrachochytrium salamandrivorans]
MSQDLIGQVAVITGANSGIGLEAAVKLASRGSIVVLCCRSAPKAESARKDVLARSKAPTTNVVVLELDLADLDQVGQFRAKYDAVEVLRSKPIDMLVLNAGVMALSERTLTKQGFEAQMATNVLGHFKFAHELLDKCIQAKQCRIVCVSSTAHKLVGKISFEDFNREQDYNKWLVYGESKLGNLLFMHKLNRLLDERQIANVVVVGCHPGYSATNLQDDTVFKYTNFMFAQSAEMGAEPTVLAATDLTAGRNAYAGPWFFDYRGAAVWGRDMTKAAKELALQDRFWDKCVQCTGCDLAAKL